MRTLLKASFILFFTFLVVFGQQSAWAQEPEENSGTTEWYMSPEPKVAPNAMWLDKTGRPYELHDFQGNVVILNIWATWCTPCLAEMPTLDKLQKRYSKAGLTVLPVALDTVGFSKMSAFFRQANIHNLPLMADPTGRLLGTLAPTKSLPVTYIIDRQGRLLGSVVGAEDWFGSKVRQLVETLLKEEDEQGHTPAASQEDEKPLPMILDVHP